MTALIPGVAPARIRTSPSLGRRARFDAVVRTVAGAALWLSLLLVTYWWVADGGIQDLGGWATGLTSLGRLTGLVASVLLLAQVLLMARVPLLEAAFGQDRLAHLHRLVGFTSFNLMLAHIVADHLGVRRRASSAATPAHPVEPGRSTTPACCWPPAAPSASSWWSSPASRPPAGGSATSRGTCCTSTPTSASAWRCRTSCGPGSEFLSSPGRDRLLVDAPGPSPPARSWSGGSALPVVAQPAAPAAGHLGGARGRRRRVGLRDRPPAGPAARRGRPVLHLALPRPAAAGPGPTPTRSPPRRTAAACGSPCRRSATAAPRASRLRPGTRALVEGPYGRLSARARTRPQGRADRRRRRHHAAAGAGRGARLRPRRRGPAAALHRRAAVRPRARRPSAASAGLQVLGLPGRRRRAGLLARRRRRHRGRPDGPALLGPRHRRARRLRLRARALDRPRPRDASLAAGLPADHLHLETFAW